MTPPRVRVHRNLSAPRGAHRRGSCPFPSFPRKREPKTTAGQSRFFFSILFATAEAMAHPRRSRGKGRAQREERHGTHDLYPANAKSDPPPKHRVDKTTPPL
jgi:hypothetical protein